MTPIEILRLIKKLENMVAFQKDCLNAGNWDDYDKVIDEIHNLENKIIRAVKAE